MFVLMGNKDKPRSQACMCAPCFESVMGELSDEFQGMKALARPPAPEGAVRAEEPVPADGPHCFACGLSPERCQCAREAYR